jgi:hypothetical protein
MSKVYCKGCKYLNNRIGELLICRNIYTAERTEFESPSCGKQIFFTPRAADVVNKNYDCQLREESLWYTIKQKLGWK